MVDEDIMVSADAIYAKSFKNNEICCNTIS